MRRIAKRHLYLTASVATVCGSILLSGCVSSTINTPEGFAATTQVPQPSDILALNNEDVLSDVEAQEEADAEGELEEDAESDVALAALAPSDTPTVESAEAVTGSIADQSAIAADAPQAVIAEATGDIDDVATQRIAAAASAPVANSTSGVETANAAPSAPVSAEATTSIAAANTPPAAPVPSAIPVPSASIAAASLVPTPQIKKAPAKNRPGFLSALFGNAPKRPAVPVGGERKISAKPAPAPQRVIATASGSGSGSALPGVNRERALGINSGPSSDNRPIQLASAAGLARLAPNGIQTQTGNVDVKCLKPALVRVLKQVERRYGKPAIVTSGYRSPSRNKRASGAKNSLHMYCAAADIQVEGVDKWTLAKYLRSMPGRGGVGTYCHTKSVHIDIGPNRDWNWRCRRKK